MTTKRLLLTFTLLLSCLITLGQGDIPAPMDPPRLVNDFAGLFGTEQEEQLEDMLRAYHDSTSTQIYVVTVDNLNGYSVSDFAITMGNEWGIGQKDKNNGVLILIKPRKDRERGQVFIATGYGTEHILTDALCGQIIDNYMIPHLREGNYYAASYAASKIIMQFLASEFSADKKTPSLWELILGGICCLLLPFLYILKMIKKANEKEETVSYTSTSYRRRSYFELDENPDEEKKKDIAPKPKKERPFSGGGGGSFGGGGAGRSF